MKNLFKAALIAGALAVSSFATTPAAAQVGFSFSYGTAPYGYARGYAPYDRSCRPVTRVRYDRYGYRRYVRTVVCQPAYRGGYYNYGTGYRPGYGYGYDYRY